VIRPVLEALPGQYDQVERAQLFLAANEGSAIGGAQGSRTGIVLVSGKPRKAAADTLEGLLDEMEALADLEAKRRTLQADYPGRRIWLSDGFRWYGTLQRSVLLLQEDGATRSAPMTLDADAEAGLRELLAAERAKERRSAEPGG
jgi:hypothetical protein